MSAADCAFLDGLFDFLFDPGGAQRVEVRIAYQLPDGGGTHEEDRRGWHVAAKQRVFFADGTSMPTTSAKAMAKIDFVAACKDRLATKPFDPDDPFAWSDPFSYTHDRDELVLAAWLHRLGHAKLAAQMLARARVAGQQPDDELAAGLLNEFTAVAFTQLASSFAPGGRRGS